MKMTLLCGEMLLCGSGRVYISWQWRNRRFDPSVPQLALYCLATSIFTFVFTLVSVCLSFYCCYGQQQVSSSECKHKRCLHISWLDSSMPRDMYLARLNHGRACSTGGTTGNTASQVQKEGSPAEFPRDSIMFTALLTKDNVSVRVRIGDNEWKRANVDFSHAGRQRGRPVLRLGSHGRPDGGRSRSRWWMAAVTSSSR